MEVQLRVVGCSPAWPNPGSAQSGYLVEGSGRVLFDCGSGVLAQLRALDGWPRVDAVVITHYHLDHYGDLVPWVWGALFGPGRDAPRAELWVPPGTSEQLDHLGMHFWQADMFRQAFDVREYPEDETFTAGGLELTATRVLHYEMQTYGLRARENGRTLAYSGDSGPCPQLADIARDADLFLCEATLRDGAADGPTRGHLAVDEAVAAYKEGGADRLLLTHRPQELPVDDGYELARDGLLVPVGSASAV
jgi:ribonuclease BN (tRNA processing enzyme)